MDLTHYLFNDIKIMVSPYLPDDAMFVNQKTFNKMNQWKKENLKTDAQQTHRAIEIQLDKEMFGDEPNMYGLENLGCK